MHTYLILTKLLTGTVRENNMADLIGMRCSGQSYNNIANNPKSQWPNITEFIFCPQKTRYGPASPLRQSLLVVSQ